MRQHLIRASAILALAIAAAACGGTTPSASSTTPASTCVNAGDAHHAYVVVQHLSGVTVQKCVGFTSDTIDAQTLMDESKIEYQTQTFSFGKAVCQVDNEPRQFTECLPQNAPYWDLFIESAGAWTVASTGYTQVTLHDKEAIGWRYVQSSDPSPSPPPPAKES